MRTPSISRGIKRGPIHRLDNPDIQRVSVRLKIPPYPLFPPHFSREFTHILSEEDSALSLIDHFPLAEAWPLLSASVKHHPCNPPYIQRAPMSSRIFCTTFHPSRSSCLCGGSGKPTEKPCISNPAFTHAAREYRWKATLRGHNFF